MVHIVVHTHHLSAVFLFPAFPGLWHNAVFMALRGHGTPHAKGIEASSGCGLRFIFCDSLVKFVEGENHGQDGC
jgi:hypothetical protein